MDQIVTRHRFDTRRRTLTVADKHWLTPHMIRIVLTGADLAGFTSLAPDDHIKLFFDTGADTPAMRDYTPRAFGDGTLTIDFAVHEAGPATDWAVAAQPGDPLAIGGPRGSAVVTGAFDWWLLIGDETALPAIGRWAEEMPPSARLTTLAAIPSVDDRQVFPSRATLDSRWVIRPGVDADKPGALLAAAQGLVLPPGRGFIWIAAEAGVARALRDHFAKDRGHPLHWMKAAGYWTRGLADASDKTLD